MANYERIVEQKGMIRTELDVSDAMEDFVNGVANKTVLLGAAVKASKKIMKPKVVQLYGSEPNRITGALSKTSSTQVKGIWYKDDKTGVAIIGQKTNNITTHALPPSKAHAMEKWHASLVARNQVGMYRVAPGLSVRNPGGRGTILNEKPWKISNTVRFDTKPYRKKTKKVVMVTRNPSRIAHLIEKGHRFPLGGKKATAYEVIRKAFDQVGNATKAVMLADIEKRGKAAAERAEKKLSARMAQRAGVEL